MTLITHPDGTVHFSQLKKFARSPAHYKHACESTNEPTRAMRIGTAVHQRVLGARSDHRLEVFPGDRRQGKVWDAFATLHAGAEILTQPEWDESEPIAAAVLSDPVARRLLEGARFEVPLKWEDGGLPCSTGGIDVVGPGYLADLKVASNAEPERFKRHALDMLYHAQMVWYRLGTQLIEPPAIVRNPDYSEVSRAKFAEQLRNLGTESVIMLDDQVRFEYVAPRPVESLHLIAVEDSAPYCVTVLTLSPDVIEHGEKCVRSWLERLKVCAESNAWPGYAQSPVEWSLPEWASEVEIDT